MDRGVLAVTEFKGHVIGATIKPPDPWTAPHVRVNRIIISGILLYKKYFTGPSLGWTLPFNIVFRTVIVNKIEKRYLPSTHPQNMHIRFAINFKGSELSKRPPQWASGYKLLLYTNASNECLPIYFLSNWNVLNRDSSDCNLSSLLIHFFSHH